jgi:ribonuclease HI
MSTSAAHTAHVDGGARGNPGPSGYGVVIHDAQGKKVAELSQYLGHQTNNYAEYNGLLAALRYAIANHIHALKIVSDSELIVRQMKGTYKVRHPELKKLFDQAQQLTAQITWNSSTLCGSTITPRIASPMKPWTAGSRPCTERLLRW